MPFIFNLQTVSTARRRWRSSVSRPDVVGCGREVAEWVNKTTSVLETKKDKLPMKLLNDQKHRTPNLAALYEQREHTNLHTPPSDAKEHHRNEGEAGRTYSMPTVTPSSRHRQPETKTQPENKT